MIGRAIARRIAATIPVVAVVAIVVFLLLRLSAGDPAAIIAGDHADAEQIARIRERLGLDQPITIQFLRWLLDILRGDLGVSIFTNVPVTTLIAQRAEPTFMLSLSTMLFSFLVAVPLGMVAAARAGRTADGLLMGGAMLAFSLPVFVTGYALVYLLAISQPVFPVQGYRRIADGIGPFLSHLALPTLSLGLVYTALLARITRATFIEVLAQDYMRTARAKGLPRARVMLTHGLKNAAVPIVTTIGLGVALLLGGVVVTESVFAIPGIGRLTVDALLRRDYPVIQGVILVFSFVYIGLNLAIDLLYLVLDPRIRAVAS